MIFTAAEFKRLRESSDPDEYRQAATDEAPPEIWKEIVETMPEMWFWVAQNKMVPIEILGRLARCEDAKVRAMVAAKRKITESIALVLAGDGDEMVRASLARNANLPVAVRDVLRNDPSALVRDALDADRDWEGRE